MKQRYAEFWVLLTSDKRKMFVLLGLLVVAVVLWLKMALTGQPTRASASSGAVAGSAEVEAGAELTGDGEFEVAPLVVLQRIEPLTRDLFAPGPAFGVQSLQTDQSDDSVPKSAEGSDDNSPVSPELQRLELERLVREEASRLHLSGIMIGVNPVAVIQIDGSNDTRSFVGVGDSVLGFELVEVTARDVVLVKNGIRVELSIGRR